MDVKPPIDAEVWEGIPGEAQAALLAVFAELAARITQLEQVVTEQQAELERLRKNSRNSSFPPSSDKPDFKRARPKKRGQRNRGGQQGHDKHQRRLVPTEHVDTVEPCKPTTCNDCGEPLAGDDPDFERRQVWEIPPIKPEVTEYQVHTLKCSCCGGRTRGELPEGVGRGCACSKTAAVCRELLARKEALWTFAYVDGVEPTNNEGEREIRHPVAYRKLCYGTDSAQGSKFVGNIMTVVGTLRRQGRAALPFLAACCDAFRKATPPPSPFAPSDLNTSIESAAIGS
jgi:hypothetical protein